MEGVFAEIAKQFITGIISFSSVFVSTISGVNPEFSSPQLNIEGKTVFITTKLQNFSTPELDNIFSSGIPVRINFDVEIFQNNTSIIPFFKTRITREIQFDNLNKTFLVKYIDEKKSREFSNLENAKNWMINLSHVKVKLEKIPNHKPFVLIISANPEYIVLSEFDEKIDLLLYWNLNRPRISLNLPRKLFIE